jgi:hypothetical protein
VYLSGNGLRIVWCTSPVFSSFVCSDWNDRRINSPIDRKKTGMTGKPERLERLLRHCSDEKNCPDSVGDADQIRSMNNETVYNSRIFRMTHTAYSSNIILCGQFIGVLSVRWPLCSARLPIFCHVLSGNGNKRLLRKLIV